MPRLYLDNAATSFPKPPAVLEAMTRYATELGASPGRGAYAEARQAGQLLYRCRERINTLINGQSPDHVVFTLNTSDALNLAIRGVVLKHPGRPRHLITTDLDHNSVLRPFNALCAADPTVTQTRLPCDPATGLVDPDDLRAAITPDTVLVAAVHGSNVTGTVQPVRELGAICREHAVPFLVDAAQTVGHLPLDVQHDHIDLLAAPGHKGLLGPLGTGFLYLRPGLEDRMTTVREGGTGTGRDTQPTDMPDRFEPGSHNAIGIIGLSEGVNYILQRGLDNLWQHEQELIAATLQGLSNIEGLRLLGPQTLAHRCGVFAVRLDAFTQTEDSDTSAGGGGGPQQLADRLEQEFGILTRAGIHCAPHAHRTMQTDLDGGATRLSLGPFVTTQDVAYATDALAQLAQHAATAWAH